MKYRTLEAQLKVQNSLEDMAQLHKVGDVPEVRRSMQYFMESGITDSQMEYVEELIRTFVYAIEKRYE